MRDRDDRPARPSRPGVIPIRRSEPRCWVTVTSIELPNKGPVSIALYRLDAAGRAMPPLLKGEKHEGKAQLVGDRSRRSGSADQLQRTRRFGRGEATLSELLRVREHPQRTDQGHLTAAAQPLLGRLEAVQGLRPLRQGEKGH